MPTGPLSFTYYVTPQVTVQTNVFGDNRSNASVAIYSGSMQVWGATLTQLATTAKTPTELILGDATIAAGATFTLTIPTALQQGNVLLNAVIGSSSNPPAPVVAYVATWPLTSAPSGAGGGNG